MSQRHIKQEKDSRLPSNVSKLLLFFLLSASFARSQQFTFADYGAASGLSNLNAMALLEDHTGLLWAATQSGIFTADGATFQKQKAFTDAGLEFVRALREDKAGRIWAVDGRHLVYLEAGQVHQISDVHLNVLSHEALDLALAGDASDSIYLLRAGELLLINSIDHGVHWTVAPALAQKLMARNPALRKITSIAPGSDGNLWMGCGVAICEFNPSRQAVRQYGEGQGVHADTWTALRMSRSGSVWARGSHSIVFQDESGGRFGTSVLPDHYAQDVRWPLLLQDPQGRFIVNLSTGIAIGGRDGWRVLSVQNGLPEDEVEAMLFDGSGALWLTSAGHGILRWHGYGNWEGWSKKNGLSSNIVWSIARDAVGRRWISTDKGLNELAAGADHVSPVPSLDGRIFPLVVDHRKHVWTSDRTGTIFEFDPATRRTRVAATNLDRVFSLHIDRQQRIWVCSRKGLLSFSREDGWRKPHSFEQESLAGTYAWSMAEGPDGTLWLATGKGLFRLSGLTWTAIAMPSLPETANRNFMLAVARDGTLWMQSKQPFPLIHLRVDGHSASIISRVSSSTITSDNITFVETDQRGWIWVGTDAGVNVFNGERWIACSSEDGLLWDDTDFHAFLADPDGSVWIGTSAGVSHLLHPESLFATSAPKVRITEVLLSGQPVLRNRQSFDLRKPVLSFQFLNTNYSRESAIHEKYKLSGVENDWQEAVGNLIRFPSLAAGTYRLEVIAHDERLQSSSAIKTFTFIVLEPWWKRLWFEMIEALICVLILLAIWRFSVHLLVLRQVELERLVASRTAELESEKKELLSARTALLEVVRRDALTGLFNRAAIFEILSDLCESSRVSGINVAIVMADLDSFKHINDTYGHLAGDAVLRECSSRITKITRPVDSIGRYGGEELLILMPGLQIGNLHQRMEQLRLSIAGEPFLHNGLALNVSCSFGVAWLASEYRTVEAVLNLADDALYIAKQNGRNRVEYAKTIQAHLQNDSLLTQPSNHTKKLLHQSAANVH